MTKQPSESGRDPSTRLLQQEAQKTPDKLAPLSLPQFSQLENGNHNSIHLAGLLFQLKKKTNNNDGASLVAQRQRFHLPVQERV